MKLSFVRHVDTLYFSPSYYSLEYRFHKPLTVAIEGIKRCSS